MRVNHESRDDGPQEQGGGSGGMRAPGGRSGGTQPSRTSGAMRAPSGGGGGSQQREGADTPGSRTDRGNQNDEDIGSSASRGGGGGEANAAPSE